MSTNTRRNPGSAARRQATAQNKMPAWMKWLSLLCAVAILAGTVAFALYQKDLIAVVDGLRITGEEVRKQAYLNYIANPLNVDITSEATFDTAAYYAILNPPRLEEARRRGLTEITEEDQTEMDYLLEDIELTHLLAAGYGMELDFDYEALFYGYGEPNVSDQAYLESLVGSSAHDLYVEALKSFSLSEDDIVAYLKEALVLDKLEQEINNEANETVTDDDRTVYFEAYKDEKFTLLSLSHVLRKTFSEGEDGEQFDFTQEQLDETRGIIDQVYQQALAGYDFAELATQFSEDEGSMSSGGSLGEYTVEEVLTNFVTPFNTTAAALTEAGQISDIIETDFGFHVIRLDSIVEQTFDEVKDDIDSAISMERSNLIKLDILEKFDIKPADLRDNLITQAQANSKGW